MVEILRHRVCACIHARTYYITELSHVGKLREVREVREVSEVREVREVREKLERS